MKKIGILFGMENTFPWAFIDKINSMGLKDIIAEPVRVDIVEQGMVNEYAVIIDRISQDVPFYRAYLKNAALAGTAVINNPFWWSADEKFFNNSLALRVGVPVPKTVLLPSFERPDDTREESFRNLAFPLSWEAIFEHIGFPAYMKPHSGGGWKSVYKVNNREELFKAYHETNQLVMLLQEEIQFDAYFRCYCIGRKHVRIMHYEPRNPHHLRYAAEHKVSKEMLATIEDYVLRLNNALGYDFNTVEFAIRDGVPYAIDFCNPAPDADVHSVGQENFDWVIEHAAKYAVEVAQSQSFDKTNLTWGSFMQNSTVGKGMGNTAAKASKTTAAKETPAKSAPAKTTPAKTAAPAKEATPAKATVKKADTTVNDDLTKIEGIGPAISKLLKADGINSFAELARASDKRLRDILTAAGKRYAMHDPATWAQQAALASAGKFDELKALQDKLNGGK